MIDRGLGRGLARALVLVAAVAPVAAADTVTLPTCGPPAQTNAKARSLRDIDWCNYDVGGWKGDLHAGRNEVHLYRDLGEPHDTISVSLRGVVYGDLDGDKRPEAAVVLERVTWIGRTGDHSGGTSVQVYRFSSGKPVELGTIATGTPVETITFARGRITVTSGEDPNKTTVTFRRIKGAFQSVP